MTDIHTTYEANTEFKRHFSVFSCFHTNPHDQGDHNEARKQPNITDRYIYFHTNPHDWGDHNEA